MFAPHLDPHDSLSSSQRDGHPHESLHLPLCCTICASKSGTLISCFWSLGKSTHSWIYGKGSTQNTWWNGGRSCVRQQYQCNRLYTLQVSVHSFLFIQLPHHLDASLKTAHDGLAFGPSGQQTGPRASVPDVSRRGCMVVALPNPSGDRKGAG